MSTEFAIKEPYKFSVEDYFLMTETGVLKQGERTELLDGEIIKMGAINSPHASCVARSSFIFTTRFAGKVIVWNQNPIRLNNQSMPQPDLAILKHRPDFYVSSHPTPEDILVVIEVSDSTLMYDRNVKAESYARAGIGFYWIFNLPQKIVEIFSASDGERYTQTTTATLTDSIAVLGFSDIKIKVADLLG